MLQLSNVEYSEKKTQLQVPSDICTESVYTYIFTFSIILSVLILEYKGGKSETNIRKCYNLWSERFRKLKWKLTGHKIFKIVNVETECLFTWTAFGIFQELNRIEFRSFKAFKFNLILR